MSISSSANIDHPKIKNGTQNNNEVGDIHLNSVVDMTIEAVSVKSSQTNYYFIIKNGNSQPHNS